MTYEQAGDRTSRVRRTIRARARITWLHKLTSYTDRELDALSQEEKVHLPVPLSSAASWMRRLFSCRRMETTELDEQRATRYSTVDAQTVDARPI